MPPTPPNIWQSFYESNCMELTCRLDALRLGRSIISKFRDCFGGKRKNLPFRFAGAYAGDRKERIGVFCEVERPKGAVFAVYIRWFRVFGDPPAEFGKFSDFLNCAASAIGDQEARILATFSYDRERVSSVFSPIQMGSEAGIFDEIVGFTGIKRSPQGKLLYKLEVTFGSKRLEHNVTFFQTIRLAEELPLGLLDIATRVSNLGLKKRELNHDTPR